MVTRTKLVLPPPDTDYVVSQEGSVQDTLVKVILPKEVKFVAGGLANYVDNWRAISQDPVTLNAVTGLTIPFSTIPPCRLPTWEELNREDVDPVVDESIAEILALKAAVIVPPDSPGFYSRVFTVPKLERGVEYGRRFIINLKVSFSAI